MATFKFIGDVKAAVLAFADDPFPCCWSRAAFESCALWLRLPSRADATEYDSD